MRGKLVSILLVVCAIALIAQPRAYAYPDAEITGVTGGPPLDFGFTDNPTAFIAKDNGTLLVTYGQVLRIIDLGLFELAATQPKDLIDDDDDTNDSPFNAAYYASFTDEVMISQERGYIVIYSLANLDDDPLEAEVSSGKSLGPLVVNSTSTRAYITNNTDRTIHVMQLSDMTVTNTITVGTLPGGYNDYTFTSGIFVEGSSKCYFTTDRGYVVVLEDGGTTVTTMSTASIAGDTLYDIAVTPDDAYLYVSNKTDVTVEKFSIATGAYVKTIDISENTEPRGIIVIGVTNPTATYAYVAGGAPGLSVIDTTNNDTVLDLGTGPNDHEPMPTSSAPYLLTAGTDGYVYMNLVTTNVGIVSNNPWVTIISLTYSGGGETLGTGETADFTFLTDRDGTYEFRIGGGVDASGSLLEDINGNTSGTVVADTDTTVQIPYDANSSLFSEGTNKVYIFVTDSSGNLGRNGDYVSVDTPPDEVTLRSTGFGNSRIYVVFDRLTAEDMDHYNVYVDTDPAEVLVKTDVAATVSQPSGGSTVTGKVSGLTNGTLYYIAVEGVDEGGNVSPTRANTLPDGSLASATPEVTVGPAGFAGDGGCTLGSNETSPSPFFILFTILPALLIIRRRSWITARRLSKIIILTLAITLALVAGVAKSAHAEEIGEDIVVKKSPQWWSFELKTGFWIPTASTTKRFFGPCCNLITRAQGGLLVHGRYGVEESIGFMYKSGRALGASGAKSMDSFTLITIPMETNFVWRADYFSWRYLIPYMKAGIDYVYWNEDIEGSSTNGLKWGAHGVLGMMIALGEITDEVARLDHDMGLNDMHITLETQYQWINNFGGGGLNLGGWLFSIGLLFVF